MKFVDYLEMPVSNPTSIPNFHSTMKKLAEYKSIIKMGFRDTTTPMMLQRGNLQFTNDEAQIGYQIYANGYLRRFPIVKGQQQDFQMLARLDALKSVDDYVNALNTLISKMQKGVERQQKKAYEQQYPRLKNGNLDVPEEVVKYVVDAMIQKGYTLDRKECFTNNFFGWDAGFLTFKPKKTIWFEAMEAHEDDEGRRRGKGIFNINVDYSRKSANFADVPGTAGFSQHNPKTGKPLFYRNVNDVQAIIKKIKPLIDQIKDRN